MKKKHTGLIICLILAVLVVAGILTAVLHKNADRETGTLTGTPAPAETVTPTLEPTPAVEPTAAELPTPTVTVAPTNTPTLTPVTELTKIPVTVEPTKEPTIEPTFVPTLEPTKTPTSTPTPTATPTPTPSPTPTATPEPTPTPLVEYKKDGVDVPIVQTFQVSDTTYIYIYENGKTAVADVETGYSQRLGTSYKNPETVTVTEVVERVQKYSDYLDEDKFSIDAVYRPTPTPTPTPFPTPNPEQPKKLASYTGDKEDGDVTVEAWDNGYLYVKGTGVLEKYFSMSYCPKDLVDYWATGRASGVEVTHIIIEEGITEIKDFPYWANNSYNDRKTIEYIEFPSTLTKVNREDFDIHFTHDVTVVGYKDGQKVTYILKTDGNILSDSESLYDVMTTYFDIR